MRTNGRKYSQREDDFIRANYRAMSSGDMAVRLGRSIRSIESRLGDIGVRRFKTKRFTPEEDQVILNGRARSSVDIAKQLVRAPATIRLRARRLGIPSWFDFTAEHRFTGYKTARGAAAGSNGRSIKEHRHVMEQHLGRRLTDRERVHHINLDKRDNRIENLHLCKSGSAHSLAHHSINGIIPVLLKRGVITFNRASGVYQLCEINN